MSIGPNTRAIEMLNEVGAYALAPDDQPRSLDRTYEYYVGWRGCIMYLQSSVHNREVQTEATLRDLISDSRLAGEQMLSAFAYTHEACSDEDDLAEVALGDTTLSTLIRFARGWIAAADKADERLTQVTEHIFRPDA